MNEFSPPSSPTREFSLNKRQNQIGSDLFTGSHSIFDNVIRQFDDLQLSTDFKKRPLYVCPDGHVFLETFSPFYKPAYDFIISIAEPISRPKYIQEYQISTYSLYSAVSIGLTAEEIIYVLSLFSKVEIDENLKRIIKSTIEMVGKLKLILKNKRYFVQSTDISLLSYVAKEFDQFRTKEKNPDDKIDENTGFIIPDLEEEAKNSNIGLKSFLSSLEELGIGVDFDNEADDFFDDIVDNEFENRGNPFSADDLVQSDEPRTTEDDTEKNKTSSSQPPNFTTTANLHFTTMSGLKDSVRRFEIRGDSLRDVRKTALSLNIPFTDEYDFHADESNPNLSIDLRRTTIVRSYQEKALSKMFGGSRAKSGVIVLPCGAGKTLVGITAACTIRKSTIVFCDSNISADQWVEQFKRYTNISPKDIFLFTSEAKVGLPAVNAPCVLVTTYSINVAGRSKSVQAAMSRIYEKEWGLMIMDEVQSLVAETVSTVIDKINAHAKLGLTATLVREDDRIINLNYLVGPRLYEANWIDLSEQGFIARVKCFEIWCKMTGNFYREYLNCKDGVERQRVIASLNPNKFNAVERLIRYHESRGDKILVFADVLQVLAAYGSKLRKSQFGNRVRPVLSGSTSLDDRQRIFSEFKNSSRVNCIFISRIGDKAIDLPDANVLIQVCSHFGARMQEAQRLGRILRRKPGKSAEFNAFFYTVISEDTREMYYSAKRRRFLTDQGYVFEVVQQNSGDGEDQLEKRWPLSVRGEPLMFADESKHGELLKEALKDFTQPEEFTKEKDEEKETEKKEETSEKEKVVSVRSFNPFGDFDTQFSNI